MLNFKHISVALLLISGIAGFSLSLYNHKMSLDNIPIKNQATFHSPTLIVAQLKQDSHAGEKIFKSFCAACHAENPVISIGAPRINDKKTWHALKQIGVPTLLAITIQGKRAMPARGGCFECSDEQLQQAIEYMLGS